MNTSDESSAPSGSASASSEQPESWNAFRWRNDDDPSSSSEPLNTSITSNDRSNTSITSNDRSNTSITSQSTSEQNWSYNTTIFQLLNRQIPHRRFPEKYVLYCFDKKLIPKCIKDRYKSEIRPDLKESSIYLWIKPTVIAGDTDIEVKRSNANEPLHYIVRMYSISTMNSSEFFAAVKFGDDLETIEIQKIFLCSILIIPMKNPDLAMVYCFGNVTSLINKFAIVEQFGLKSTATKLICKETCRIKELMVDTPYHYNRKLKTTKTDALDSIDGFTPVIGAEYFNMLRLKPDGVKRLVKGSNRFEFSLPVPKEDQNTSDAIRSHTLTLIEISQKLYEIYTNISTVYNIHEEYKDFILKEIDNAVTKQELNRQLVTILKKDRPLYDNYFLRLNPDIFCWGLGTQLKYWAGNVQNNDDDDLINSGEFLDALHDTMKQSDSNLESIIKVTNNKGKTEEDLVCALLIANVIEYDRSFYHYTFGKWFLIPETRYKYIMKAMDRKKVEYETLGLIPYTKEQHNTTETQTLGNIKIVKELRYNIDAVKKLIHHEESGIRGILIDRILINYPSPNKFEFGDIFVTDNNQRGPDADPEELHYIIHMKRKASKGFEKQCNQMIRCANFLDSALTKKFYKSLMLQGCINSLYANHGRALILDHVSDSNQLTHGTTIKATGSEWQNQVIRNIKRHATRQTDFHRCMRPNQARTFFEKYPILNEHKKACVAAINALVDCCETDGDNVTFEEAEIFFRTVEHFIGVAGRLFGTAKLNQEVRSKTYIIFAIIDDSVTRPVEYNEELRLRKYFTYNELLGLELVQQTIERMGFKFRWTWIEKNFTIPRRTAPEDTD